MSYICGTTVSRSKNAAPNEYGHLWEEIEQNRPSTVKEKPSFTKETHEAKIGPLDLSVKDKQTVNVPVWAGVGVVVIGGTLQVVGAGKENR